MSASEKIDSATLSEQAIAFRNTAFNTEDGAKTSNLTSFSWAGGKSSYSFGLYQFDVKNNPLASAALSSLGFTDTEIAQLRMQGGIDAQTLSSLNSQLQSALSTTAGQQTLQELESSYESSLTNTVAEIINDIDGTISSQILSDPDAIQRVFDFANQFSPNTLSSLSDFLDGDSVTSKNTGISAAWDSSLSATDNLQGWFSSLSFGESVAGIKRSTAFNSAVATENLPETIIDVSLGEGDNPNIANFSNLQNVQVNVDAGITVNVSGVSAGDTFNIGSGSNIVASTSASNINTYSYSNVDGLQSIATVSGDAIISTAQSPSGNLSITASDSVINLAPDTSVNIIGDDNVITGGSTDNVSVFGSDNSAFLGGDSTGTIIGAGNTIIGSAADNFSIYGDANDVHQLTETKINSLDGTSQDTIYNTSAGDWSAITNTYSGQNETGTLTDTLTENLDGTSRDTSYSNTGDGTTVTNSYSGPDLPPGLDTTLT